MSISTELFGLAAAVANGDMGVVAAAERVDRWGTELPLTERFRAKREQLCPTAPRIDRRDFMLPPYGSHEPFSDSPLYPDICYQECELSEWDSDQERVARRVLR
ncbi:hypothetical protein NY486_08980, partial [Enterobacter hormaechei]|nr:hypothetical protein [Enterobacter hormaechei]